MQEALQVARVAELGRPTLGDGESYQQLLADREAFEDSWERYLPPERGLRSATTPQVNDGAENPAFSIRHRARAAASRR